MCLQVYPTGQVQEPSRDRWLPPVVVIRMVCRYGSRLDPRTLAEIICRSVEKEIGPTRPSAQ